MAWFAAARLLDEGKTGWELAGRRDVQEWMAWLLGRYSDAYGSNQYRALQQFFKWLCLANLDPGRLRAGERVQRISSGFQRMESAGQART